MLIFWKSFLNFCDIWLNTSFWRARSYVWDELKEKIASGSEWNRPQNIPERQQKIDLTCLEQLGEESRGRLQTHVDGGKNAFDFV